MNESSKNYRNGIEVKRDTNMGVLVEKASWLNIAEELFPNSEKIYYPNDQDHVLHAVHKNIDIAFIAGQGSSMAACMAERLRVYGAEALVRIGTCGALSGNIKPWVPVITTGAYSDEGTSPHYLPKGFPILSDLDLNNAIIESLGRHGIPFQKGITITTDGRWREDPILLKQLGELGVATIEMETSAILAVGLFRKIMSAAINIPTDTPAEESEHDFKGIPDRKAYPKNIDRSLRTLMPAVADALVSIKKGGH